MFRIAIDHKKLALPAGIGNAAARSPGEGTSQWIDAEDFVTEESDVNRKDVYLML
jgi:hypothetical protein